MKRGTKRILSLLTIMLVSAVVVTTAWAAFVHDDDQEGTFAVTSEFKTNHLLKSSPVKSRARAPEPSTMALFSSGLLGMILSFVQRAYLLAKRAFDIAIAVIAVILLSPLFLITALLIKCVSKGPALFTQTRVGKGGQHFKIYKFRTMRVDAEKNTGAVWAKEDDPRVIPCGRFLRKTHIDEIPQFFNVLQGHMSFIGPRPERPIFVDQFKREVVDYEKRLAVKPGITGLAQVWHRYDETIRDVRKKIMYDLLYIKKQCLWTDLQICFRTVRVVFTGEGAR